MTPHPREDWVSRFSEPDTGIVCSCQQRLPASPGKCHLSILALLLTQWRPRLGRGREEVNCLVSLGGEIPSGAELGSRCVLCEQEDDFIHRLNNWRTQQRWGWSWYQTFIWGLTGCLGLKLGSGGETRSAHHGFEGCCVGSSCESPSPLPDPRDFASLREVQESLDRELCALLSHTHPDKDHSGRPHPHLPPATSSLTSRSSCLPHTPLLSRMCSLEASMPKSRGEVHHVWDRRLGKRYQA